MQVTRELAEFVSGVRSEDVPEQARDLARRALLDTIGVMLVGSREECAQIAAEVVKARGAQAVSTVVGQGFRTSPDGAALANGVAAHALDFDDVNSAMTGHPSVSLVAALLAAGEETRSPGREVLTAFVIGFEVEAKLGRALGSSHYARGWHATGTIGVLGATAAVTRIYHLTSDQTHMALGIAASLAGGLRQNFGTMTKPLHPGYAAQNGIVAAQLAARGYTADAEIIEAPIGYLSLFSPAGDANPEAVIGMGRPFEILESGISVKNYPCCFATHRALEATLGMIDAEHPAVEEVEHVQVTMPRGAATPLIHSRPSTGLEGKFSMEYCVAAALLDGRVGLDSFEDAAVQRPAAQELLRRVELRTADVDSSPAEGFAEVHIQLRNGSSLERRVDDPRGGPENPLTLDELTAKYLDCAQRVLGNEGARHSLELILEAERLDSITELGEALARSAVSAPA